MLKLYGFNTQNNLKGLLTAEELKLKYEYVSLRPTLGEHKSKEHFKRHPLGKIPALEHDGKLLFESNTICRYLASLNPSTLYPQIPWERCQVDQWIDFITLHVGRWINVFYFEECIKPLFFKKAADSDKFFEARGFLSESLETLDKQLGSHRFLAGQVITIADVIGYAYFNASTKSSFSFSRYNNVSRWYKLLNERESFQSAIQIAEKASY